MARKGTKRGKGKTSLPSHHSASKQSPKDHSEIVMAEDHQDTKAESSTSQGREDLDTKQPTSVPNSGRQALQISTTHSDSHADLTAVSAPSSPLSDVPSDLFEVEYGASNNGHELDNIRQHAEPSQDKTVPASISNKSASIAVPFLAPQSSIDESFKAKDPELSSGESDPSVKTSSGASNETHVESRPLEFLNTGREKTVEENYSTGKDISSKSDLSRFLALKNKKHPNKPSLAASATAIEHNAATASIKSRSPSTGPVTVEPRRGPRSQGASITQEASSARVDAHNLAGNITHAKTPERDLSYPPASSKPSRKRAAPVKFTDKAQAGPPLKKTATPKGRPNASYLLQNSKSTLVKANLGDIFSDDRAWSSLTPEQQEEVLALLPDSASESVEHGPRRIQSKFLKYDSHWRDGLRAFQENLQAGYNQPGWQKRAASAMEARARGKFDQHQAFNFEVKYGETPHKPSEINDAVEKLVQDRRAGLNPVGASPSSK
ncbi:MAG: hypothetical protein M4579_000196 [Chaenotheca gracillima]|nr:MAG: hypothetical protein M4579_000196 [Chaenotheca gracillima]